MAIKLTGNYAKKIGLPGYSSHSFSISAEVEVMGVEDIQEEACLLYQTLQTAVDEEIQEVGYIPGNQATSNGKPENGNGTHHIPPTRNTRPTTPPAAWNCTEKQKHLLLKLVSQNQLSRDDVENLAIQRFGKGVRDLDRLQASGLISELIEQNGGARK